MGLTRVQRTHPATLSHLWYSSGETLADPTGTPTAAVVAADAVSVQSGNATITGSGSGQTTFALNGVSTLELLTATWTATVGGVSRVETDHVEVVGGRLFTLAEARASDSSLSDTADYTTAELEVGRLETELEVERICDRAFFPQYQRVTLDGTGNWEVLLEHNGDDRTAGDITSIRSVYMADRIDGTFTAFTADELAELVVTEDGYLRRVTGDEWTEERSNVIVEYEYGFAYPPPDLKRWAMVRLRHWLNVHRSGTPDRVISYSVDGATYRMAQPSAYTTGVPDIDAAYQGYSRRERPKPAGAVSQHIPASRTLSYDPQHYSMYHRRR